MVTALLGFLAGLLVICNDPTTAILWFFLLACGVLMHGIYRMVQTGKTHFSAESGPEVDVYKAEKPIQFWFIIVCYGLGAIFFSGITMWALIRQLR